MQGRVKKGVVALCCAMLMVASVLTVSAAARHVCIKEDVVVSTQGPYSWISDEQHSAVATVETRCSVTGCSNKFGRRDKNIEEGHSWYRIDDLGHGARYSHTYRLTCGDCGGQRVVTIICDYINSGRHDTP